MKIGTASVAAFFLASSCAAYSQSGHVPGQPSIDCTRARNTVAIVLCNDPEAAAADWEVNSASWAYYFSLSESRHRIVDAEEQAWRQSLDRICSLPRQPTPEDQAGQAMGQVIGRMVLGPGFNIQGPQPVTRAHVNCLIRAYHARAAALRSKLTGDALIESRMSPERHVQIQEALAENGFLSSASGTHDGEFGPITRRAIKDFQQSIGAPATGFLSGDQRLALLETPEERQARAERAEAEARAKQEAEQRARIETERRAAQAEADRKASEEAERKRLEAIAAEKRAREEAERRRLEAEAEAAKEWARRVDEARTKGVPYAAQAGAKWTLSEKPNPMTDDNDYTVRSVQPNGSGAEALIEGTCQKPGRVVFLATLNETGDHSNPLGLPTFQNGAIVGEKRINDEPAFPRAFPNDIFKNRIIVSTLSSLDPTESIETTWRVLAQVETTRGPVLMRIPMFDDNVQKLLAACKRRGEIANRRTGGTTGLNSQ